MIDDAQKDLAIEYVLGDLTGDARREFETWLESDPDMRALVEELQESAAALAHSVPITAAPAHLRAAIVGTAVAEMESAPTPRRWMPWAAGAVAAGLAIGCLALAIDRNRWQAATRKATAELAARDSAAKAAESARAGVVGSLMLAEMQGKVHAEQISELSAELAKLRNRDALAEMKIATLSAQLDSFSRAGAMIVWDPEDQRGIICLSNLPRPAEGKEYQLWVVDPAEASPVNAGSIQISETGAAQLTFKPVRPVGNVEKFAISLEAAGAAVAQVSGPIVLSGIGALPQAP